MTCLLNSKMIQMFEIHYTTKFKKDYKTITRRGYQLELLKDVIRSLAKKRITAKKVFTTPT